jgi:hypothetical protein
MLSKRNAIAAGVVTKIMHGHTINNEDLEVAHGELEGIIACLEVFGKERTINAIEKLSLMHENRVNNGDM